MNDLAEAIASLTTAFAICLLTVALLALGGR